MTKEQYTTKLSEMGYNAVLESSARNPEGSVAYPWFEEGEE